MAGLRRQINTVPKKKSARPLPHHRFYLLGGTTAPTYRSEMYVASAKSTTP